MNNSSLNNPFLIKSYSDENGSFYRVYSDGWCEQGGIYTSDSNARVINMNIPFANTLYDVVCIPTTAYPYSFSFYASGEGNPSKQNNKFSLACSIGGAAGWNWIACGYVNLNEVL